MKERFFAALPGWIYLLCGAGALASLLIIPAWLACEDLRWQRDVLRGQIDHLQATEQRYSQLHHAAVNEDPLLIERLAYVQLGYTNMDRSPLVLEAPVLRGSPLIAMGSDQPDTPMLEAVAPAEVSACIDTWLRRQVERPVSDVPPPPQHQSRLVRLSTGSTRLAMFAFAFIAILAGVFWSKSGPQDETSR